ncbi:MAG: lysozyme inhibitor LprI family protein [Acidobacteriota bacterium]|nr:lysozyme inhibitor LprI family protein [Acidobacteriota bacterium]
MNKFLFTGLFCALAACALSGGASAQRKAAAQSNPCEEARTQSELNECADREYKKADAELNRAYQQLMRASGGSDAKLKTAQLAWIKFRDAECDYEAAGAEGGSMQPMVYSFCLADVTKARTKQLRDALKEVQAQE